MPHFLLSSLTLLLLFPITAENNQPLGKITLPLGKVTSQPPGKYSWLKARVNQDVFVNEKIRTKAKSRCEITLDSRRVIRIGEKSIVTLAEAGPGVHSYNMKNGKAWLSIFSKNNKIRVLTPTAIAGIRGTIFNVDCDDYFSTFSVREGTVTVTPLGRGGSALDTVFIVQAGNVLNVVNNFDDYIQKQLREKEEFKNQDGRSFQEFIRQQNEEYQNFVNEEKKSFSEYQSIYYSQTAIDMANDRQLDWVSWNLERDALIEK